MPRLLGKEMKGEQRELRKTPAEEYDNGPIKGSERSHALIRRVMSAGIQGIVAFTCLV